MQLSSQQATQLSRQLAQSTQVSTQVSGLLAADASHQTEQSTINAGVRCLYLGLSVNTAHPFQLQLSSQQAAQSTQVSIQVSSLVMADTSLMSAISTVTATTSITVSALLSTDVKLDASLSSLVQEVEANLNSALSSSAVATAERASLSAEVSTATSNIQEIPLFTLMRIARNGKSILTFDDAFGDTHTLDISEPATRAGTGGRGFIYQPKTATNGARYLLSLTVGYFILLQLRDFIVTCRELSAWHARSLAMRMIKSVPSAS